MRYTHQGQSRQYKGHFATICIVQSESYVLKINYRDAAITFTISKKSPREFSFPQTLYLYQMQKTIPDQVLPLIRNQFGL
jgi:hypothetical protein